MRVNALKAPSRAIDAYSAFADTKQQHVALACARFKPIAGLVQQVRDVDGRERVRAFGDEHVAGFQPGQSFAHAQRRQRTFESAQIERLLGHEVSFSACSTYRGRVSGEPTI